MNTTTAGQPAERDSSADPVGAAIARFQAGTGRQEAFRLLYETYFHAIRRLFLRKGLSLEDSVDLTQETFLRVYTSLDGYEHRQRFAPWLYRVATTLFLKRHRALATQKRSAVEVSHEALDRPSGGLTIASRQLDDLVNTERRDQLKEAVRELPEQMRACLTLRLYHQLTYEEIATVQKISVETVKAHLFRARKRLRTELQEPP
ncbi:MAG: RNA polymerase sigma factor [Acidobacteriota bacterium]